MACPAFRPSLFVLVAVATLALLAGGTWLAGQRAEVHVDDTEHLHVAARVAAGERLYVDVFQKQAGPFWALLRPVVRAADGDPAAGLPSALLGAGGAGGGRALALARGRTYLTPQDVFDVAPEILRHRILLSYEALAQDVDVDQILTRILSTVPAPRVGEPAEPVAVATGTWTANPSPAATGDGAAWGAPNQ